jgi:hypothetical protein
MLQAARSLKFTDESGRPYILAKRSTVVSQVAVIFGYGDNRLACRDIAEALTPQYPEVRRMHPDTGIMSATRLTDCGRPKAAVS